MTHPLSSISAPQGLRKSGLLPVFYKAILGLTPQFSPAGRQVSCCVSPLLSCHQFNSVPLATRGLADHYGKMGSVGFHYYSAIKDSVISAPTQIIGNVIHRTVVDSR